MRIRKLSETVEAVNTLKQYGGDHEQLLKVVDSMELSVREYHEIRCLLDDSIKRCNCCGRLFNTEGLSHELCSKCQGAFEIEKSEDSVVSRITVLVTTIVRDSHGNSDIIEHVRGMLQQHFLNVDSIKRTLDNRL